MKWDHVNFNHSRHAIVHAGGQLAGRLQGGNYNKAHSGWRSNDLTHVDEHLHVVCFGAGAVLVGSHICITHALYHNEILFFTFFKLELFA